MFKFTDDDVKNAEHDSVGRIAEGEYTGIITKAEMVKTQAGHATIKIEAKLSNGQTLRERFNLEHPAAKEISAKTVIKILSNGVLKVKQSFATFIELANYMRGVPIKVRVKHKGENDKGFMNYGMTWLKPESQITKDDDNIQF